MSDPTAPDVERYIADHLPCEHLSVEGDGRHFFATIVSAQFDGCSRVQRHQRVYAALGDRMRAQISRVVDAHVDTRRMGRRPGRRMT